MPHQIVHFSREQFQHSKDEADAQLRYSEQETNSWLDLKVVPVEDFESDERDLHAVMNLFELLLSWLACVLLG